QPVAAQPGNTITAATDAAGQAAAPPAKGTPKTDNPPPAPVQVMPVAPPRDNIAATPAKAATKPAQVSPRLESTREPLPADASTKLATPMAAPKPQEKRAPNNAPPAKLASAASATAGIPAPKHGPVADNTAMNIPLAEMEIGGQASNKPSLFVQRLEAGKQLLEQKKAVASIQLYYNEQINVGRVENFLLRAEESGNLSEIYLLPAKFGSKDGLRVLYGTYPSVDAARNAIHDLPKRYQDAFATSIYIF
ncbi:MAG: hypothetical protein HY935_00800, partial [Nitrosomonadales bacterium]|nr:hypothetical protein [Nitrosomonadales bacterium]